MQISDVMTDTVSYVPPTATIKEAARIMRDDDIGILPIAENDRLIGMVTDRDIVVRGMADGKDPDAMHVRDVMSDHVLYCYLDQSAEAVAANMAENQIRRLPVLNRDKRLIGIVSLGDLSAHHVREAGHALEEISEPDR